MTEDVLISIVDDDESMRSALRGLVRSHGYDAAAFESAEAFLAGDAPERSACVITDVQMPGMNGFELKASLDARGATAPVIMITARSEGTIDVRAKESGILCLLRKPFAADRLIGCVEEALDGRDG